MTLDLNKYRNAHKVNISNMIKSRNRTGEAILSEIAIATGCHIIICAHLVGELEGYTLPLESLIERLMRFYKVTEVYGVQV